MLLVLAPVANSVNTTWQRIFGTKVFSLIMLCRHCESLNSHASRPHLDAMIDRFVLRSIYLPHFCSNLSLDRLTVIGENWTLISGTGVKSKSKLMWHVHSWSKFSDKQSRDTSLLGVLNLHVTWMERASSIFSRTYYGHLQLRLHDKCSQCVYYECEFTSLSWS